VSSSAAVAANGYEVLPKYHILILRGSRCAHILKVAHESGLVYGVYRAKNTLKSASLLI